VIDPSVLDPNTLSNVQDMLEMAIMCCDRSPKALAIDIGCSISAVYEAMKGARNIPIKVRRKLSSVNLVAASAVALEATGFTRLFGYQKVDRHIQSMIIRLKKMDKPVMKALDDLPEILLDKNSKDDLSEEEATFVSETACQLVDRANGTINLIMELEVRYKLGIIEYMQGKKESALATTSTDQKVRNILLRKL